MATTLPPRQPITPAQKPSDGVNVDEAKSDNAISVYKGRKSTLCIIVAKSGRGKSHSLINLDPTTTHLINVIGKPLPFMRDMDYIEGENLTTSSDYGTVKRTMKAAANKLTTQNIIIDDGQYLMATEFMDKAGIKGYDKWTTMAMNVWDVLILSTKLRPGVKVFFLTHEEEDAQGNRKMKTLGRLLDDKITPEGLSTIVAYGDVMVEGGKRVYYFATQSDGTTNAKSPFGMFPDKIPNDIRKMSDRIDEYYQRVDLKHSKINFDLNT